MTLQEIITAVNDSEMNQKAKDRITDIIQWQMFKKFEEKRNGK